MGARQPELRARSMTPWRIAFRFFTGRPLDGHRRTDSIFIRRGRHSMDPSGHATRWSYLAGWERLVIRLIGLYVAIWVPVLLLAAAVRWLAEGVETQSPAWAAAATPGNVILTHVQWAILLGLAPGTYVAARHFGVRVRVPALSLERRGPKVRVLLDGWTTWEVEGRRTWDRRYVRPVFQVAQSVLQTSYHVRTARRFVQVPRDYRRAQGSPVIVRLPAHFSGADEGVKRRLSAGVAAKLGLKSPSVAWDLEGDNPRMLMTNPPLPPDLVSFADVRAAMESTPEFRLVLGVAARGEILSADMQSDSPHLLMSAGSGAGKSEMGKALCTQVLHWGWGLIILDWKEVSHEWARGLPGVTYVSDIEAIHNLCVRIGQEVDLRKALYRRDRTMPGVAKVLVMAEEWNITAALLQEYWQNLRSTADPEEKREMPLRSPALSGMMALNFAGRQLGMFLNMVAQRFSARVTNGNGDLRESFQNRLLARASVQTWKMLAPQIKPIPEVGNAPGRWAAVIGNICVVYQAPLITDDEAKEFAMEGAENPSTPFTRSHGLAVPSGTDADAVQGDELGDRLALPSHTGPAIEGEIVETSREVDARKLSEMVESLAHLGITLDVLRHASKDPESGFPGVFGGSPNRGYTYDFQAVALWARKRHAKRKLDGGK